MEETQRDSGGQGVDLVPLDLGQDLELPPMVSPVHDVEGGVQGDQRGEALDWGDTPMPGDTGSAVADFYS